MARARRTKKRYQDLYDDPTTLFKGATVTLFPNGENEIWVKSLDGMFSFKITGGMGPAGLGLTITRLGLGTDITVFGYGGRNDSNLPAALPDVSDVELVQYKHDERSQAFKAWVQKRGEYPGDEPTGKI